MLSSMGSILAIIFMSACRNYFIPVLSEEYACHTDSVIYAALVMEKPN